MRSRLWLLSIALIACDASRDAPSDASTPTNASATDGGPSTPVYVMGSSVFGEEGTLGYAVIVYTLDASGRVDLASSIEVPGGTSVFAQEGSGTVFVGSGESPILRRFEVDAQGVLTAAGELSFGAYGIANTWFRQEHVQIVSPTKAYVFDGPGAQILVWNPSELAIERAIPLDELASPEWSGDFGYLAFRSGSALLLTYNWRDLDFYDVRPETALVAIDTATDAVSIDRRSGCGEVTLGAPAANGDLYLTTGVHGASVFRTSGAEHGPAPCLLRVAAGTRVFDAAFTRALNELTGGRPTADLVPSGGGTGLLRVFDEGAVALAPDATAFDMRRLDGWRWWRIDLEALTTNELTNTPLGGGNTLAFRSGDATYLLGLAADYSESTILATSATAAPTPGVVVPGVVQSMVRAR